MVDTTSTTGGTSYTSKVIEKLPLGRNYAEIIRSNPGVNTDQGDTQGRALALTVYGDMDVSRLTGRPPGRKPVDTRVLSDERLDEVVEHLRKAIARGARAYWGRTNVDHEIGRPVSGRLLLL
jgi:hypothetical protein